MPSLLYYFLRLQKHREEKAERRRKRGLGGESLSGAKAARDCKIQLSGRLRACTSASKKVSKQVVRGERKGTSPEEDMLKLEQAKLPSQPRDVKVRKKLSVGSLQHLSSSALMDRPASLLATKIRWNALDLTIGDFGEWARLYKRRSQRSTTRSESLSMALTGYMIHYKKAEKAELCL